MTDWRGSDGRIGKITPEEMRIRRIRDFAVNPDLPPLIWSRGLSAIFAPLPGTGAGLMQNLGARCKRGRQALPETAGRTGSGCASLSSTSMAAAAMANFRYSDAVKGRALTEGAVARWKSRQEGR